MLSRLGSKVDPTSRQGDLFAVDQHWTNGVNVAGVLVVTDFKLSTKVVRSPLPRLGGV